jgi:hypothetical protein
VLYAPEHTSFVLSKEIFHGRSKQVTWQSVSKRRWALSLRMSLQRSFVNLIVTLQNLRFKYFTMKAPNVLLTLMLLFSIVAAIAAKIVANNRNVNVNLLPVAGGACITVTAVVPSGCKTFNTGEICTTLYNDEWYYVYQLNSNCTTFPYRKTTP